MTKYLLIIVFGVCFYLTTIIVIAHDYIECRGPPYFAPLSSSDICVHLLRKQLPNKLKKEHRCQKKDLELLGLYIDRLRQMYETNKDENNAIEQRKLIRINKKWLEKIRQKCVG